MGCQPDYEIIPERPDVDPGQVTDCGFTGISGTKLSVYDCNPVFTTTGEDWAGQFDSVGFHATEVLGHGFYELWYSANPEGQEYGGWGMGYAISGNGVDFEVHPDNPLITTSAGAWDQDGMDAIQINWDPATQQYVLAYQGFNINAGEWGMGLATSMDGVTWSKFAAPVLDFSGTAGGIHYCWPLALARTEGGMLTGYVAGGSAQDDVCQIYPVNAHSLQDWRPSSSPVLRAGPDPYDKAGMTSASIVELDGTWYMFYIGFNRWEQHTGYQTSKFHTLNLATSTDGFTWTKSNGNPFPVNNDPDALEVSAVAAQVVGTRIHLWVTDQYPEEGGLGVGYYLYEPSIDRHP